MSRPSSLLPLPSEGAARASNLRTFTATALLVRSVAYGETDLILTLLTEQEGTLGARFRAGRKSVKRAQGGVEPFHTLEVVLEDRGGDLLSVKETRITKVRSGLVGNLDAMEAAGAALRWGRHLLPPRHAEPHAWATLVWLLDALDAGDRPPLGLLAVAGLCLLGDAGYALELDRCILCGKPCPAGAPAYVDATRGGIVCRACGGAARLLDGPTRELASRAQRADGPLRDRAPLPSVDATRDLLALVTDAMAAHTGVPRPSRK